MAKKKSIRVAGVFLAALGLGIFALPSAWPLTEGPGRLNGVTRPALAAEEFSAHNNPSDGLLKSGDGKVGQGIKPGTPTGSQSPPPRDLRPELVPNRVENPDSRRTNITNRADRNRLNSPNR